MALGKALAELHGNVDLPEVPRQTIDEEWLEVIGAKGLVVTTRDQHIRYRRVEKRAWVEYRVRGFVLTGTTSQSTSDSLALLQHRWPYMDTIVDAKPDGPWMYAVTQTGLRAIVLDPDA